MNKLVYAGSMVMLACAGSVTAATDNSFNPQISLILDGHYASYDNNPEDYAIAGFQLGGEAGLVAEGFSLGHSELRMSANIDRYFYGEATFAIAEHDGETEVEIEEAFIQTLGLGQGFTVKFGRFLSSFGYQNARHRHTWDFADASLPYSAMLGGYLADDGIQLSYIVPSDIFIELTAEVLAGNAFPAGNNEQGGVGASVFNLNFGGDLGDSHAWQLGFSHYNADDISERSSSGHAHDDGAAEIPTFDGDSRIKAMDFVYKWAPYGNPQQRHVKFSAEYFERNESGNISLLNSGPPLETSSYDGTQSGWYASLVYQFIPRWRSGVRFDQLDSNNAGSDNAVLQEASLASSTDKPQRSSIMLEWLPSEYSRLRLQYNHDQSTAVDDKQWLLQYTFSLGAHGAHSF